jgi:hypothetical protein
VPGGLAGARVRERRRDDAAERVVGVDRPSPPPELRSSVEPPNAPAKSAGG